MERTINSTFTKEISTAVSNGWNLTFTVEKLAEEPKTIQVVGQKEQSYFNAHRNESGNISVSFSGSGGYDSALATAVIDEINNIVTPVE